MSLDGKTVTALNDDKKISCQESQQHCHAIRACVDAILVGSNTICHDDPLLTVRFFSSDEILEKHPVRIILSNSEKIPSSAKIFSPTLPGKTIIVTTDKKYQTHIPSHVEIVEIKKNKYGKVDLISLLDELGKRQIISLLVEGGEQVHQQFFDENLVNKINVYLAPNIVASLEKKIPLSNLQVSQIGRDYHFLVSM